MVCKFLKHVTCSSVFQLDFTCQFIIVEFEYQYTLISDISLW